MQSTDVSAEERKPSVEFKQGHFGYVLKYTAYFQ